MSDIHCAKCGEPWDSTGGLHFSHSDLPEDEYSALLKGQGCPCCDEVLDGGFGHDMETVVLWQKSVERLSEGDPDYMYHTFDVQPALD